MTNYLVFIEDNEGILLNECDAKRLEMTAKFNNQFVTLVECDPELSELMNEVLDELI